MSASFEIDTLDEHNRWLDLNEDMSEKVWTADKGGEEKASFSELLLTDSMVEYHHRDKKEQDKVEAELLNALGSEQHKENQSIMDLTSKVHSLKADLRSVEIQLNHAQLQVESLSSAEQNLQSERDSLQFALAESEQDRLLLETKLANIAGFEGGRGNDDLSLAGIRGKLLEMANNSIKELNETVQELKGVNQSEKKREQIVKLSAQNKALREELKDLTDQIAKRTILYSAQERKYNDSLRTNHALHIEKSDEISELRARLQQMEKQFELVDRERVEVILRNREKDLDQKTLQTQLSEAMERIQGLDSELTTLTTQNASLQTTVEHLRGANFEELERGLVAEVELIKAESATREAELKHQLESARELISQEAKNRDTLVDEIVQLRAEVEDKVGLLHKLHSVQQKGTLAEATKHLAPIHPEESDREAFIEHMGEDDKDFSALFEEDQSASRPVSPRNLDADLFYDSSGGPNILYGSNLTHSTLHVLKLMISELFGEGETPDADESVLLEVIREGSKWLNEADGGETFQALQSRIKAMIEDAYDSVHRELDDKNPWAQLSLTVTNILGEVASRVEHVKRRERKTDRARIQHVDNLQEDASQAISIGSLAPTKAILLGEDMDDAANAGDETVATSVADALQEELTALKEELVVRRRREQRLRQSLKDQGSKLATVLQRAAQLPMQGEAESAHIAAPTAAPAFDNATNASADKLAVALDEAVCEMQRVRTELAREKADKDVMSERAAGYQEEIRALQEEVTGCHSLLKLAGDETGRGFFQHILSLEKKMEELQGVADGMGRRKVAGEGAAEDVTEDADAVVGALAGQFEEVNKRKFLEAEMIALQDQLVDKDEELDRVKGLLDEAVRTSGEGGAGRVTALETEREKMKKQMEALVSSMQQDYEAKLNEMNETGGRGNRECAEDSVDIGLQTEFNPGDSVIDQRVQFAVAQQRVSDEQKWSQTLEVQRLSLIREHQLDLADKVATLQREFEEEIIATERNAKSKYETRVHDLRERHEQEKEKLIKLIKRLGESSPRDEADKSYKGNEDTDLAVFPEMLSPEQTAVMVKSISGHPMTSSQTVMRASIDSSGASSGTNSYREGPSQVSNEESFQSDDLEFKSARNSMEALEASMDVSKRSLDSSITTSPPHWESMSLRVSPTTGERQNVSNMETPPIHVLKDTPTSAKISRTTSQRKGKSSKASSPPRRVHAKDTKPLTIAPYSSVRRSLDRSPDKVLRPAAVSRTPELSRQNPSSVRKKRGVAETGKTKAIGVPRRFPLAGM